MQGLGGRRMSLAPQLSKERMSAIPGGWGGLESPGHNLGRFLGPHDPHLGRMRCWSLGKASAEMWLRAQRDSREAQSGHEAEAQKWGVQGGPGGLGCGGKVLPPTLSTEQQGGRLEPQGSR